MTSSTTPQDQSAFKNLLGTGSQWGLQLNYAVQKRPDGLAQAFLIAEDFIRGHPSCLILGDNILYGHGLPELLRRGAVCSCFRNASAEATRPPPALPTGGGASWSQRKSANAGTRITMTVPVWRTAYARKPATNGRPPSPTGCRVPPPKQGRSSHRRDGAGRGRSRAHDRRACELRRAREKPLRPRSWLRLLSPARAGQTARLSTARSQFPS